MNLKKNIKYGLILCGLVNILSILIVTRLFTDYSVSYYQPVVMGKPGLVMILIWGFAYLIIASKIEFAPKMLLVFIAEKLFFVYEWAGWIKYHYSLVPEMITKDFLSGGFQLIYGVNDLAWALFFVFSYFALNKNYSQIY